jgi:long-subunit acyl-CoA synthetase (AMP-forming)
MDQQNQVLAAAVSGLGVLLLELVRRIFERRQEQIEDDEDQRREKLISDAQSQAQEAYEDQIAQLRRELRESRREVRLREQQLEQAREQITQILKLRDKHAEAAAVQAPVRRRRRPPQKPAPQS